MAERTKKNGGVRFMRVPLLSTERALKTHGRKNKEDCIVWSSLAVYARTSTEYWKSFNNLRREEQRRLRIPLLSTERAITTYGGKNKENCREGTSHAAYAHTSTKYWKSFNNLQWEEQRKLPRGNFTRGRWNMTNKTLYKEIDWLYKEIIL